MKIAARALDGLVVVGLCACLEPTPARATDAGFPPPAADAMADGGTPGWLSRTYGSFEWRSGDDPRGVVETVQPIYQSEDRARTLFFQGRGSYSDGDWLMNLGGGFRWMLPDNPDWMFGVNAFYDRQFDPDHARWGAGVEAIGRFTTFRANYYDPTSGWITVAATPTTLIQEKALEGWDAELEAPLAFAPWASVSGGYYHWDVTSPGTSDIDGFRGLLRMDLNQSMRLETGIEADNHETAFLLNFRIALGPSEHVEYTARDQYDGVAYAYQGRDVSRHALVRVERHNEIPVERRVVSIASGAATSGGVVIRRGR
jgi:hypothetical protein